MTALNSLLGSYSAAVADQNAPSHVRNVQRRRRVGALPKHWYKTTVRECPLCGRGDMFRERIYGEKPKDPYATYVHEDFYDYCDAL